MFGRAVKIDGKEFFVMCNPDTPYSEVLRRAAQMAEHEERSMAERDPNVRQYRTALDR